MPKNIIKNSVNTDGSGIKDVINQFFATKDFNTDAANKIESYILSGYGDDVRKAYDKKLDSMPSEKIPMSFLAYSDKIERMIKKSKEMGDIIYTNQMAKKQREYDEEIRQGKEKIKKLNEDILEEKKHNKIKRIIMAVICFLISGILLLIQYKDLFNDMKVIIDKIKEGNFNVLDDIYSILKIVANTAFIAAPMLLGIYQIIQLRKELNEADDIIANNNTKRLDSIISEAQKRLENKTIEILRNYSNTIKNS